MAEMPPHQRLESWLSRHLGQIEAPGSLWERIDRQITAEEVARRTPVAQSRSSLWNAAAMVALLATATAFPFFARTAHSVAPNQFIRPAEWVETCAPPIEKQVRRASALGNPAAHQRGFSVTAFHQDAEETACNRCHSMI